MATLTAGRPALAARALPAFDYLFVAASAWLLGGLYRDGRAHGYGLLGSFWTIRHAAFDAGFVAVALVLFAAIARARPNATSWRGPIPVGMSSRPSASSFSRSVARSTPRGTRRSASRRAPTRCSRRATSPSAPALPSSCPGRWSRAHAAPTAAISRRSSRPFSR